MLAHIYRNGKHTVLKFEPSDLEEIIARCGWTVMDNLQTSNSKESMIAAVIIQRLEARGYVESAYSDDTLGAIDWWKRRIVSEEPAITPDI